MSDNLPKNTNTKVKTCKLQRRRIRWARQSQNVDSNQEFQHFIQQNAQGLSQDLVNVVCGNHLSARAVLEQTFNASQIMKLLGYSLSALKTNMKKTGANELQGCIIEDDDVILTYQGFRKLAFFNREIRVQFEVLDLLITSHREAQLLRSRREHREERRRLQEANKKIWNIARAMDKSLQEYKRLCDEKQIVNDNLENQLMEARREMREMEQNMHGKNDCDETECQNETESECQNESECQDEAVLEDVSIEDLQKMCIG